MAAPKTRTTKELSPFAIRLKEAQDAAGIKQRPLERAAGLGNGYLSRIYSGERGHRMAPDMVDRLAKALGVRMVWLMTGRGTMREDTVSGVRPTLEEFVAMHPNRWSQRVVQTVAVAYADERPRAGWEATLNEFAKIVGEK